MLVLSLIFRLVFFEKCSFFSSATRQQQQNIHKSKMTHPYRTPCMKMTQFRRRRQKIWSIKEDQNFFCFVQIIQYDIIKSERCNFKKSCHFSLHFCGHSSKIVIRLCFLVFNSMNVWQNKSEFFGVKKLLRMNSLPKIWQVFYSNFNNRSFHQA